MNNQTINQITNNINAAYEAAYNDDRNVTALLVAVTRQRGRIDDRESFYRRGWTKDRAQRNRIRRKLRRRLDGIASACADVLEDVPRDLPGWHHILAAVNRLDRIERFAE